MVQADELLPFRTILISPTSTSAPGAPFRLEIILDGASTRVMVEQTRAVDPERLGRFAGRLDGRELVMLDEALKLVLGL